jgi:hypothetical protein
MSSQEQKKWALNRKVEIVVEPLKGGNAVAICRTNGASWSRLFEWRDQLLESVKAGLKVRKTEEDKKVGHLERIIARLMMEDEILKKTEQIRCRKK